MKLQSKITLIIAGAWLAICLILYADSRWVIAANYHKLEYNLAEMEVRDVQRAYNRSLHTLQMYGIAWSVWDEAYAFMAVKDPKFIASNFVVGTFASANLNFVMFYTTAGKLYKGGFYDLKHDEISPVPHSMLSYIEDNKNFIKHENTNSKKLGIVSTKDGLVLLSSLPILTSDQKGPMRGTLLMGFYLNEFYFAQLSDTVGLDLSFISMSDIIKNPELNAIFTRVLENPADNIALFSDKIAHGYLLLKDIASNPVGMIQIDIPRVVYQQGISTVAHYFYIVVILGLFVILLMWWLLRKFVANRVINISKQVQRISRGNRFNKKINFSGNDELSSMVVSINSLIQMIDNSQTQLTYLATHDSLTELPNRELFYDLLSHAMTAAARGGYRIAVLYLDMDQFKQVNDEYGHHIGDKLLQFIAQRLKNVIRGNDIAARQSGDEFIIMMNHVDDMASVAKFVENLLAVGTKPVTINDIKIHPIFSVGISIYHGDAISPDELMRQADEAMYAAKKIVGNSYQFYDAEITHDNE